MGARLIAVYRPEKVRAETRLFGGSWYAHLTRRFLVVVGLLAFESISAAELPDASSEKVYVSFNDDMNITFFGISTASIKLSSLELHAIYTDPIQVKRRRRTLADTCSFPSEMLTQTLG
ncbi:hypothetical protein E4T47_05681 [Aureobasidium subglaciale]|nr:hypothetical protein E4T43_02023 [Aureobasidium subglaciale]KAI5270986.1 hypothetical protein E4T47_05681 [Aureobasidium subglaciale]